MDSTNTTPFWLDLRKEYIDDNFEKLLAYLQENASNNKDMFYETTLHLLRLRIEDLLSTLSSHPLYLEEIDRKEVIFNLKLLGAYLLVDCHHPLGLTAYVTFMYELGLLNPRFANAIVETIMKRLKHEHISNLGFSWSDLDKIGTDVFAHNICTFTTFDTPLKKPLFYEAFGTACLNANGLFLTHEPLENAKKLLRSGADSLETLIGSRLRTSTGQKLKSSQKDSIVGMDEFVKDFILEQCKVKVKEPVSKLKYYYEEEEVLVKITSIDHKGNIHVETVDPAYHKIEGCLVFEKPSLVYYYTNTLHESFRAGDYLKATLTDSLNGTFNIEKQLVDYFVDSVKEALDDYGSNHLFLSKVIDVQPNFTVWLNDWGIAMYTKRDEDYMRGDFAELSVRNIGEGPYYGKIDATIEQDSMSTFDEKSIRNDCIRAYAEYEEAPVITVEEEHNAKLSPVLLRILIRLFFHYQKTLLKPAERYLYLANAHVIAELVDDKISASYIAFTSTYLRVLVQFVSNEDISGIELEPDEEYADATSTLVRLSVLELLKEYGKKEYSETLADAVKDFEVKMPMLANLAKLIQTSNAMQEILSKSSLNVIKREIIKTLSLETENDADLESESGSYLGVESGTQEFKTSMVYPSNNNMQPDEYNQNLNVLRAICAFLNSTTGGVVYLGVNDQGYVTGIESDLKFLKNQSIDGYMRYVQDIAHKHFGTDTLPYLRIEPLFDNTVVAIHIEPHPYRVVELDGVSYIRVNAESREMPEQVRLELIARKVFKDKNKAAAISQLQHACTKKKCAILHQYASSHTGVVSDRMVEAYDIRTEDDLVICYDCDKKDSRVFNLNRIGYVEIVKDQPWQNTSQHQEIKVDVFHMSGDHPIRVVLQLDLMAKNQLVEEYPRAKEDLRRHLGNENIWYFDTKVYQIEGIGRFYLGLANHIKILDSPDLKQYVAEFKQKYL